MKIDNLGKKIWSKAVSGYKVLALPDNGFIVLPGTNSTNKIELIRFDKDGNQLWKHQSDYERDDYSLLTDSWLFKYGANHYVYCLHASIPYPKLIINVINNEGNLINSSIINLNYNADIKGVSVTNTLDNGFLITCSNVTYPNLKLHGVIDLIKIPRFEVLGN